MQILGVTEVARYLNSLLRRDALLSDLWVRGEIASLSHSAAGHYYFSLRDATSQLRCVLFRGSAARLGTVPQNGAAVVLHGSMSLYEGSGACQLNVDLLYPEGLGLAQIKLEALRARLEKEGLFAPERKRGLPAFPRRIGLVTSGTGAVLHDILQVLGRRYPLAELVLAPASVQGERAPDEICAALDRLAREHTLGHTLDVIIVARGGGSQQDLAAFNEERVVRAFFGCPIPTVSAIGHETDVTLADLAADVRAVTPSAAAELVAPDVREIRQQVTDYVRRAEQATQARLAAARADLQLAERRLFSRSPRTQIAGLRAEIKALLYQGLASVEQRLGLAHEQVRGRLLQLEALSPARTLERGYAICTLESGLVVRSIEQVAQDDRLDVRLFDGRVASRVVGRQRVGSSRKAAEAPDGITADIL